VSRLGLDGGSAALFLVMIMIMSALTHSW